MPSSLLSRTAGRPVLATAPAGRVRWRRASAGPAARPRVRRLQPGQARDAEHIGGGRGRTRAASPPAARPWPGRRTPRRARPGRAHPVRPAGSRRTPDLAAAAARARSPGRTAPRPQPPAARRSPGRRSPRCPGRRHRRRAPSATVPGGRRQRAERGPAHAGPPLPQGAGQVGDDQSELRRSVIVRSSGGRVSGSVLTAPGRARRLRRARGEAGPGRAGALGWSGGGSAERIAAAIRARLASRERVAATSAEVTASWANNTRP